jgi:hypothetical protein
MPTPFMIEKRNGKMAEHSKDVFKGQFEQWPDGLYLINAKQTKGTFNARRYKYWFDCVLGLALPRVRDFFAMADSNAQMHTPDTVEQLHAILRVVYNPLTIVSSTTGRVTTIGQTTTMLNDTDFINEFSETIIADLSGAPYYAFPDTGCPDRQEWADMRKAGEWERFKKEWTSL